MKFFIKKKNILCSKPKFTTGFTLVELLVTIVIFVMLTGVVLFKQSSFDSSIFLKNLAYDIALTIRQAQTYGVNVKESQVSGKFSSYGVYFNLSSEGGTNKSFVFFSDIGRYNVSDIFEYQPNKEFDGLMSCPTDDVECVQKYNIRKGSYISNICAGNDSDDCYNNSGDRLLIYFQRPNPEALIYLDDDISVNKRYAEVTVSSADGSTRVVVITSIGQIYIKR